MEQSEKPDHTLIMLVEKRGEIGGSSGAPPPASGSRSRTRRRVNRKKIDDAMYDIQEHAFRLRSLLTMQSQFLWDAEPNDEIDHARFGTDLAHDEAQRILDLLNEVI